MGQLQWASGMQLTFVTRWEYYVNKPAKQIPIDHNFRSNRRSIGTKNKKSSPYHPTMNSSSHLTLLNTQLARREGFYSGQGIPFRNVKTVQQALQTVVFLNNLGVKCYEQSQFAAAGQYFLDALEHSNGIFFSPLPHKHGHLKSVLLQLPENITEKDDNYDEGMNIHCQCPILIHAGITFQDTACCLFYNLGQLLARVGLDKDALTCFTRALSFLQDASAGKNKSTTGIVSIVEILCCIGSAQYRNLAYDEAVITYTNALGAARTIPLLESHRMLLVAATLNSLGVLYLYISVGTTKALKLFSEALSIYRSVLGVDAQTKEIATLLNNIGRAYYMSKKHNEADRKSGRERV